MRSSLQLQYDKIHVPYMKEVELMMSLDEEMAKETIIEAQETAGFNEPPQRLAIGGHFNFLLEWSTRGHQGSDVNKPCGKLLEQIEKQFTSFDGFRESFKKAVDSRILPGWVWLGVQKSKPDLVITQTNNMDNPLMHGVAEVLCTPLFGMDLWEHAYFYQHQGDKSAYCDELL
jgi:Fe-Mn family superoxide dismutase